MSKIAVSVVEVNNFYDASTGARNARVVFESKERKPTSEGEKPALRFELVVEGQDEINRFTRVKDFEVHVLDPLTESLPTPPAPLEPEAPVEPPVEPPVEKPHKAHKAPKAAKHDGDGTEGVKV